MEKRSVYVAVGLLAGVLLGLFVYSMLFQPMGWYFQSQNMEQMPVKSTYGDGRYYPPGCCQGPVNFESNGERIYYTGINEKGERIPFTGGPTWLKVHGGSCVNCHGRDGKGGIVPMMCNEKTPDIRYSELREEGMSDEEIKIAITKGTHENETLDYCMPRWQMSDEDLIDTIEYLKKLD
ncbi:cytochrome C oxidase subunit II [Archaeoglobales archaeon]|nr:MAG: cytochrome C oxidase subunit II [Archaeoglobales archaeon]